jgi:hypothetical protein
MSECISIGAAIAYGVGGAIAIIFLFSWLSLFNRHFPKGGD